MFLCYNLNMDYAQQRKADRQNAWKRSKKQHDKSFNSRNQLMEEKKQKRFPDQEEYDDLDHSF